MDDGRFDQLARVFSSPGSRRGLLRLLATLPLVGAVVALLGVSPAGADGSGACVGCGHRRKRRNRNGHHHQKHKGQRQRQQKQRRQKRKKKGCTPESPAQTCEDQCGTVQNNCRQDVECGACACVPACSACEICDPDTSECVADPSVVGESCGTGQICNDENQCVPCGGDGQPCCPDGQCGDALVCDPQNDRCSPAGIEFVLSGSADPTTPLRADDDMQVLLNGQIILDDTNGVTSEIAPFVFRAQPGDTLRVIAINAQPVCISLRPLYLHLVGSTGQPQALDPVGVPQSCDNHQPGIFYDETFTIAP